MRNLGGALSVSFALLFGLVPLIVVADDDRWWPDQALPRRIARTREDPVRPLQMLVQSVAGLAAKSVNQGLGDELVWVHSRNADVEMWYECFLKGHPAIEIADELGPWALVDRFVKCGLIKGYLLYTADKSEGKTNDYRPEMNLSVNVATSLAGLMDGVIIDESLEEDAKSHGLSLLFDARNLTQAQCFEQYKTRFNRKMLCTQDPRKTNLRDLAIAQQAFVIYGSDEPLESTLAWLEPLSPIAGWNGGDEFETTRLSSRYAHLQTATDWCMNLPVLMAGSDQYTPPQIESFDPGTINWNDKRSCVSYLMTDGDNVQWLESSFVGNPSYWACPERGKIPFGWSCCLAQLDQLAPVVIDKLVASKTPNDHFIEWGSGYYYPDLFGEARENLVELLARHAQRTWKFMKKTGTRLVAFNVAKVDSPDAIKAYQTFAEQTDGLSAILVFQYAPYEDGAGKTFWMKDRLGIEIPVITARYSIWEHSNERERSGTPAKVAREIQESASGEMHRHDWVIVHAWSFFQESKGPDENAENMPQEDAAKSGGLRGYMPAVWNSERLPPDVRVVSPEELVWRIRMEHDAATTKRLFEQKKVSQDQTIR